MDNAGADLHHRVSVVVGARNIQVAVFIGVRIRHAGRRETASADGVVHGVFKVAALAVAEPHLRGLGFPIILDQEKHRAADDQDRG